MSKARSIIAVIIDQTCEITGVQAREMELRPVRGAIITRAFQLPPVMDDRARQRTALPVSLK